MTKTRKTARRNGGALVVRLIFGAGCGPGIPAGGGKT